MYIPVKFENSIEKSDIEAEIKSFKEIGIKEKEIEEFLRKNITLIFGEEETLIVVGQQVPNENGGISDLTAIDAEGNIVLIEIKRDIEDIKSRKEPFEFQAIRYAASYAKLKTPEDVVDTIYTRYIDRHKNEYDLGDLTPNEKARRELNQFLVNNDALKTFNSKQRIILIASAFDDQTLSAVAWLISNNVDISCFTITPLQIGNQSFLDIIKVLPPEQLDRFYVNIASKTSFIKQGSVKVTQDKIKRTTLPRMNKLFEWNILKAGDALKIKNFDQSEAEVVDSNNVRFQNETIPYNTWGQRVTGWSTINIYDWAIATGQDKTLAQLRAEKMAEMENMIPDIDEGD